MTNHINEMRFFMEVSKHEKTAVIQESVIEEVQVEQDHSVNIFEDIQDAISKMKYYQESSSDNTYAMGVEVGLNMAAEWLENLIDKYRAE